MSSGIAREAEGGRWKRYPAYKDSGVEWLGAVPEGWEVKRVDAFTSIFRHPVSAESLSGREVFHYSIPIVQETGTGQLEDGGEIESNKTLISEQVLLVSKLNPRKGTIVLASPQQKITVCSGEFVPLVPRQCVPKYLEYVYHCEGVRQLLSSRVESVTRSHQRVNPTEIYKMFWSWPPLPEQRTIAAFLDRETGRIDALIAKKERQIELLQEKRTALISHAVTNGLDPDAPMKDSGVEWLGAVPEHWNVTKLNHLSHKIGDGIHATPIYVDESNYRFINGNNLVNGSISITNSTRCVSKEEYETHKVDLDKNTILLSINGTIGNVAFYNNELVILGKSAAYIVCIKELSRRFLFYWLLSEMIHIFYALEVTGTTIYNLSLDSVRTMPIILPSFPEQHAITTFLDRETGRIDALTAKVRESVTKLREYRTALISAAVTGKIDVRAELVS